MELREQIATVMREMRCNNDPDYPCPTPDKACSECRAELIVKYLFTPAQLVALTDGGHVEVATKDRPKIVCLCGSTRFVDIYNEYRKIFTLKGYIVLSIEIVTTQSQKDDPQFSNTELKKQLDELHKRKIDLADEVFVINKSNYIGESTASEIAYAKAHGKPIYYLESPQ